MVKPKKKRLQVPTIISCKYHKKKAENTTKNSTKCKTRGTLSIKLTQMDKYLRQTRKRRIYTHKILVTQECLYNCNQRPGSNTHETYTFPKIWESKATEYRHLVLQTKTTGTNQKKMYTCDAHKKLRQCAAENPSTKEIVAAGKIRNTYQNRKSSQVGYVNSILTGYTRLEINGHQVDPRSDGILSVHFSLGELRQQQVK